uniref:Uncharacterized protein n=1 Tax=Scherffelia dubia TaxID=3190 RepID=A0A142BYH4_SCHDU|nr:hypothetical protein [Scherffelia dubia]YP_009241559.1 hypothetical protein [Scherffelia dubia]AMP43429.1 hypothetical protein [Scherffelia dubia]AMP43466.1 hypothetical protein [Scherffelia dubia]
MNYAVLFIFIFIIFMFWLRPLKNIQNQKMKDFACMLSLIILLHIGMPFYETEELKILQHAYLVEKKYIEYLIEAIQFLLEENELEISLFETLTGL